MQNLSVLCLNSDLEFLSFKDEVFDRSISTCVFHHLYNPLRGLFELRRVTKSGGLISIYVPCDPGFLYRFVKKFITVPKQNKYFKRNNFNLDSNIFNVVDHKSNVYTIINAIRYVYRNDEIRISRFPFPLISWNFNLFLIFQIRKFDNSMSETHFRH